MASIETLSDELIESGPGGPLVGEVHGGGDLESAEGLRTAGMQGMPDAVLGPGGFRDDA